MPDLKGLFLQDKVFAYPTEGVWGLGCNPFSEKAVKKLINLRGQIKNLLGINLLLSTKL